MSHSSLTNDFPNLKDDYDFDIELDFDLMGIEQDEAGDDDAPNEIKEWVEDKPKPNLDQTITINIGTPENPKELKNRGRPDPPPESGDN